MHMPKEKTRISFLFAAVSTLVVLAFTPVAAALEVPPVIHVPEPVSSINSTPTSTGGSTDTGCDPISGKVSGCTTNIPLPSIKIPVPNTSISTNSSGISIKTPYTQVTIPTAKAQSEIQTLQQAGSSYISKLSSQAPSTAQSAAAIEKACTSLQSKLNQQISSYSKNAQSQLGTFMSVYNKVQAYATSAGVSSSSYSSLIDTANTQLQNATKTVDVLKSIAGPISCSSANPATALATVKSAVDASQSSLQSYQQAIEAVISNLESNTNL